MCTTINKAANFGKNLINLDTVLGEQQTSIHLVVYFDWKTVIYVCGKCCTQFMLPMEKSVTFTGACANENQSIYYNFNKYSY
jgi:hypothetical protein